VTEYQDKAIARETKELADSLAATKDLMLPLLKFHLLAERALDRLILARLTRGDRLLTGARLTFAQKLALVNAFDTIPDAAVQALRQVNRVRNQCSHVRAKAIAVDDIDRIGQPLGPEYREIKREHGHDLRQLLVHTLVVVYAPYLVANLRAEGTIPGPEKPQSK
jgi:hypothetical protein